jgi:hypothetical protein
MNRGLTAVVALVLSAGLVAACSSGSIPAGQESSTEGAFTGGWACACPNGESSCMLACNQAGGGNGGSVIAQAGTCQNGQPYCGVYAEDGGLGCACPNGASSCSITCPDGALGSCSSGKAICPQPVDGGTGDAGGCCPAGYETIDCTNPDGTKGVQCHNPLMGCASSNVCGQGCDKPSTTCGGQVDGGSSNLVWYTTCGYPLCQGDASIGDNPGCPTPGTPCTQLGATCGTASQSNCGVTLVCASQDPKGPNGTNCPISSRQYKNDIEYVDQAQLQQLHDEAIGIRLATYRYKPQVGDPNPTHLGFIIEDNLQTPAVDTTYHRADLYGYMSMIVAGMQVQEKEIAQLREQLDQAKRDAAACREGRGK